MPHDVRLLVGETIEWEAFVRSGDGAVGFRAQRN